MTKFFIPVLFLAIVFGASSNLSRSVQALSPDIVISQIYGGGGSAGAAYSHDFVELFNRGTTTVSLSGWSIQYTSATGSGLFSANVTTLSGSLDPGQYYLVQLNTGGLGGAALPAPDATGTTDVGGTSGKVVLVTSTTGLACNGSVGQPCSAGDLAQIKDLVGYGSANFFEGAGTAPSPNPSATESVLRSDNGCAETDSNSADFEAAVTNPLAAPRNTATTPVPCAPDTTPPNTTIDTNPPDPSASSSASFTFSGTDDVAVASFECDLDGGGFAACTSPKNYPGLADGSHTFQVRAIDTSGNPDLTPASFTWMIDTTVPDTTPPNTTIDTNPTDPSGSSSASFTFSGTDDVAVASFECDLDGGGFAACTSPKNYPGLADGSHTFQVRAIDTSGNPDLTPASFTWMIDTSTPSADAVFVSTTVAGTVGAVSYGSEDVLKWDGSSWSKWFDGTAAGLVAVNAKHNLNAIYISNPNTGQFVLSFAQNKRKVPGIAPSVDGMDLVEWNGSAFSLYFDGSDVGLTVLTQEKIDGLHILPGALSPVGSGCQAYLLISTKGSGRVPKPGGGQFAFRGEDILGFCAMSLGATTSGLWTMELDGSAVGMPANSTDSISANGDGSIIYLTTRGLFNVGGASGSHSMVYKLDRDTDTFSGPHFSAPAAGLDKKVDGLQLEGDLP